LTGRGNKLLGLWPLNCHIWETNVSYENAVSVFRVDMFVSFYKT